MQKPNVQRWDLFLDVKYEQIGTSGVLLEKNGAKALLLWGGTPVLRFWKKKELSPMIVKEEADIAATIDVEFMEGAFNPAGGLESVTQDLLVLDVTEEIPDLRNITELCGQMLEDAVEKNWIKRCMALLGCIMIPVLCGFTAQLRITV